MTRLFISLFHFFKDRKLLLGLLLLILFVASGLFISRLSFEEDITRIMPKDEELNRVSRVFHEFDFIDKLVITISSDEDEITPDELIEYADLLVDSIRLNLYPEYTSEIVESGGEDQVMRVYHFIRAHLPLFLDDGDYLLMDSLIRERSIRQAVERNYKTLISPASTMFKKFIVLDPLNFTSFPLNKLEEFQVTENFVLHKDHFFTRDLKHLFIFITPTYPSSESKKNNHLIQMIDTYIRVLDDRMGKATAEYYGGVAVAVGNANRIKKDITITISIAVILILIMIGLFFRRFLLFFIIFLPALIGAAVSLSIISFISHNVSAISLAIGSVLLGISIDYALHFFTHYKHVRSVKKVVGDIASPVLMSSLTTASAFLCLLIVSSDVLTDLGLFAAISVVTAAIFSLIVLPHFTKKKSEKDVEIKTGLIDKVTGYRYDKNRYIVAVVLGISILFLFFFRKVGFEGDMYAMNYLSPELAKAESNLSKLTDLTLSSTYLVSTGRDFNEALANNEKLLPEIERLKREDVISNYISISTFIASDSVQKNRIERWEQYWSATKKKKLLADLMEAGSSFHFRESAFSGIVEMINKEYQTFSGNELFDLKLPVFNEWISTSEEGVLIANQLKVDRQNRHIIYSQFGDKETILFDKTFITDKLIVILRSNFKFLIILSLSLVFTFLLLYFGRIELAAISFIPILLSWLWTLGIMGMFGISFTIFNIIISTFVFGLGIDYSLFIMRGLLQEYKYGYQNFNSYKTSILLSGATTVIGIGVLIFARHPALQSIAAVSIVGIISVIIITYTIQPILFRFLLSGARTNKAFPVTSLEIIVALYRSFVIVLFHLIFIIPLIFIRIVLLNRQKLNNGLFSLVKIFSKCILFSVGFSKRKNLHFLKLPQGRNLYLIKSDPVWGQLILFAFNRRIVFLQRDRKHSRDWFSLFFGIPGRLSNSFLSTEKPGDEMVQPISVIYLPEAGEANSENYPQLDEKIINLGLNTGLDIVPLFVCRTSANCDGKQSFLFPGRIRIALGETINLTREKPDASVSDWIKTINEGIAIQFNHFLNKFRTPDMYRKYLIRNYIFKGPILEQYLKIKMSLEDNYTLFHKSLPGKGIITDVGCGYGFMTYMLNLLAPDRIMKGIDHDEEKINLANHCHAKNDRVEFVFGNIVDTDLPESDAFIISDVLHYMPYENQEELIKQCAERLKPNGTIMIRDGDCEMKSRHAVTKLSEFFSTRLGFNKTINGKKKLYFPSKTELIRVLENLKLEVEVIDNTRYTSNLVFIASRPE